MVSWRIIFFLAAALGVLILIVLGASLFAPQEDGQLRSVGTWNSDHTQGTLGTEGAATSEEVGNTGTFDATNNTLPTFSFASAFDRAGALGAEEGDPLASLYSYLNTFAGSNSGSGQSGTSAEGGFSFNLGAKKQTGPSAEQLVLYYYGNRAGESVRTLDSLSSDSNARLSTFFENPSSETAEGVLLVASRIKNAGKGITNAGEAPAIIADKMNALAARYADTANALGALAEEHEEEAIVEAIGEYTVAVEALGGAFVAVVDAFAQQGVRFEESDAGSVFTFGGSL